MHSKDGVDAGWRAEDKEKKQSCKDHVPASLALMYGFSATNVKSGRLTVRTPAASKSVVFIVGRYNHPQVSGSLVRVKRP